LNFLCSSRKLGMLTSSMTSFWNSSMLRVIRNNP
jgi:hypothetical protein